MTSVNMGLSLQVAAGPQIAHASAVSIEAYDLISVDLAPDGAELLVDLQPGAADRVDLLFIKASRYASEITYKVSDGGNDSSEIALTLPHLYSGEMMTLFGVDPPSTLKLKNALANLPANKVAIEVFIGRRATP